MSSDKPAGNGVIVAWVPGLENTPGWISLSRKKQDALLEHTSHIQQFRQMQKLGKFGELVHLVHVQLLLDGEEMHMNPYLALLYPHDHPRTIQRKAKDLADISATIPNALLHEITHIGHDVLAKFDRIPNAALGDIRKALHNMPMLPVSTEEGAEKYLAELNGELQEERKNRRRISIEPPSQQMVEKMATNALVNYIREAKLKTSAEKRQFLTRVIGWTMQTEAIHGTLRCGRITLPANIQLGPGRPRMTEEEKQRAREARESAKRPQKGAA